VILPPMIHGNVSPQTFYERRQSIRQQLGIPNSAPLAVSVAVYPAQKGVDRTISMLREIPDLHFAAIGAKEPARLKALAAQQGVERRTRVLGYRDDVADIL